MKKLSESAINQNLEKVNHWILNKNALEKSFVFKDFDEAMNVITKIAQESKDINHHPEWTNVYNKLKIRLSTHDISGISEKDFQLATAIDSIVSYHLQQ